MVARAVGLERGGATANIRIIIIFFKMRYFICNIFYVSGPTMSQSTFPNWEGVCLHCWPVRGRCQDVKALFFTVRTGIGALLVQSTSTCCAVGVSSQPSCEVCHLFHELGAGGNQCLIVDCHYRDCGCELLQHDLFCGRVCGKVVEVIFEVFFADKVVDCGANNLWQGLWLLSTFEKVNFGVFKGKFSTIKQIFFTLNTHRN